MTHEHSQSRQKKKKISGNSESNLP
jgi:hypothetical protein